MFKPQRLIYKELRQATKEIVTEGFPTAMQYALGHPVEVVEEAGTGVKTVTDAIEKAAKGVFKGGWEGVVDTGLDKVLWQDVGAAPRSVLVEGAKSIKGMTWDTGKNIFKGEGKKAAKSFFKDGLWGAIKTPFKAAWNGVKGAVNLVPDVVMGGAKTVGHVAGIKMNKEGEFAFGDHGILPALGSVLKGAGKILLAPVGTRLKKFIMNNKEARFDTSVLGERSSSPKAENGHGSEKSKTWWNDGDAHERDDSGLAPVGIRATSAFGNKEGGHFPAKNAPAEGGHANPVKAADAHDDAFTAAMAAAQASAPHPAPALEVVQGGKSRAHGAQAHAKPKAPETPPSAPTQLAA